MKTKKKLSKKALNKKVIFILIIILLAFIIAFTYFSFRLQKTENDLPQSVQPIQKKTESIKENPLDTRGYLKADEIRIIDNNVLLINNCNVTLISTTKQQADSIGKGLENIIEYRPEVYDIINEILDNYDIKILMVKINSLKDGIYFANLIIKKDERILNLDIKPSDAIAIAVRSNSSIYAKKEFFIYNKEKC